MLPLLNESLIPEMLVARSSRDPTGLTPLTRWILDGGKNCDVFAFLAKHMTGVELAMLDGSGQRPIHQAVKQHRCAFVAIMLNHYPNLSLWRTPWAKRRWNWREAYTSVMLWTSRQ